MTKSANCAGLAPRSVQAWAVSFCTSMWPWLFFPRWVASPAGRGGRAGRFNGQYVDPHSMRLTVLLALKWYELQPNSKHLL